MTIMGTRPKPIVLHTGHSVSAVEKREREKREEDYRVSRLRLKLFGLTN